MKSISIGIIEDNLDFLQSLCGVLKQDKNLTFVTWNSAEEFWANGQSKDWDLLILDIGLPGMSGIDVLKTYHTQESRKSLVISSLQTDDAIFSALRNGASGYIWKSELDSLPETIQSILDGGSVISPSIAAKVLLSFRKPQIHSDLSGVEVLTPRERQILELIVEGDNPSQIASLFGTTVGTVRQQIKAIYKKLQVNTRVQMLKKARQFGIF
ncbi:response regulator transcription factor [Leptospira sp. 2 VSF19]|uniref:Response regulator transcription factor n=1 Tax=Leptospira soteropolitanensis TaxID=2950025 RepID=A0AAW5VMR4_9LEPT|nr:response regulator transcription factor [Leptospira soteropolitanensis]MCW7492419.1 response regulator transcription factor [Leptospira soteropolitanensis]MCW7500470.1 response regulator transcription factor [Leptospira soteropolitanensis]MCW7522860.1 response regulator transcription factor [Leptospira soteropolitanensis]MCW7526719.1 response regulator transcription factor [Leptospira soteropolitanensis]MCW7530440.1 response regulator transcription factor [Leptospira soteropolitanensis]